MNIFFDVDYTIQGADGSLRPGTEEVFHNLIGDGHDLFVWSGVGIRTPDIKRHKLTSFISNVYQKPLEDFEKGLVTWKVTSRPHFVVDDHPEIVDGIGDMVVVLTNLAELLGLSIEECVESAYDVISKRTGKMINGTFVKDN